MGGEAIPSAFAADAHDAASSTRECPALLVHVVPASATYTRLLGVGGVGVARVGVGVGVGVGVAGVGGAAGVTVATHPRRRTHTLRMVWVWEGCKVVRVGVCGRGAPGTGHQAPGATGLHPEHTSQRVQVEQCDQCVEALGFSRS